MTHLGFIVAAYAVALGVPAVLAGGAVLRLGAARRKLAAIDPRGNR